MGRLLAFWLCLSGFLVLSKNLLAINSEIDNQEHIILERSRMQLNRTVRDLVREQFALGQAQGEAQSWVAELEKLDRSLTEGERRQMELIVRLEEARRQLPELQARINADRKKLPLQRRRLAQHVRLMFSLGNQGMLKTVFSQQNAAHGRKSMLYYGRLVKARNQHFLDFRLAIARMRNDMAKSQELAATLATLNANLTEEQKYLQEERLKRAQFLEQARNEEKRHQRKVDELIQAKNQLTSFLERLSGVLDADPMPTAPAPQQPESEEQYAEEPETQESEPRPTMPATRKPATQVVVGNINDRRGQLPAPVLGRWEKRPPGLFFKVDVKTPVHAIHAGQVVYADWFRGYGLLLIVKHGEQVYSLYGHNNKILVAQGDLVESQETIAESGDTGVMDGIPGLYFEIRTKGKTVNPSSWLMVGQE